MAPPGTEKYWHGPAQTISPGGIGIGRDYVFLDSPQVSSLSIEFSCPPPDSISHCWEITGVGVHSDPFSLCLMERKVRLP